MTTHSSLITDYMGYGTHAARPATPNVASGCLAIYYETDTTSTFGWNGSAWVTLGGGGSGSVTSITAGTGLSGGVITSTGTFTANWQLGVVTSLVNLTLSGGTLTANPSLSANLGAVVNSGTVQINNVSTLNATAGGTLTIGPTSGTSDVVVNLPASGGTVTLAASPAFVRQRVLMDIVQGATASTVVLAGSFNTAPIGGSYTVSPTAGSVDQLMLMSRDGTNYTVEAANQASGPSTLGTVTQVATSGAGISGGPITGAGTLTVEWNAGTVGALGYNLAINSGTLSVVTTSALTVTAAGSTQGTATVVTADEVVVTTVSSGTGVVANPTNGVRQRLFNRGANPLSVYPPSGVQIEAYGANTAVSVPAGGVLTLVGNFTTQVYAG